MKLFSLLAILLILSGPIMAQSSGDDSLQGMIQPVWTGNQAILKISCNRGWITEVRRAGRDGEDSLVFSIYNTRGWVPGNLSISKRGIVFDPLGGGNKYFRYEASEIKEVSLKDTWNIMGGASAVKIRVAGESQTFTLNFGEDMTTMNGNKKYARPANGFLMKAIRNFEASLAEFDRLTESVRPPADSEADDEEEDTAPEVINSYDRFKDITAISTSKMLVRGTRRSIRAFAEYEFPGKVQTPPATITLYFYASASRPVFPEDELQLNFIIDDARLPLGNAKLKSEEKTASMVKQTLAISLAYDKFLQIANAKKAEFQIGKLEFKLSDANLDAFKKLIAYKTGE